MALSKRVDSAAKFTPPAPPDAKTLRKRWNKKKLSIETLANNIRSFRYTVTQDLQSADEKIFLTALAVDLMEKTAERVGNDESAANGHFGITGLNKKHVTVSGSSVLLKYKGKSGVEHEKKITDGRLAKNIKKAIKLSPNKYLLCTSDKFRIKSDRVSRFFNEFSLSPKSLRGYNANKWLVDKLDNIIPEDTEPKRKRQFNQIAKSVAKKVGHGLPTLKKHYMLPELEKRFVEDADVINLKDMGYYKNGGSVIKKGSKWREYLSSKK